MKWFPPFRADLATGTVWRGDVRIPLTHKAFALLRCLLERPGRVVSRETLLATVWADTHVHPDNVKVLVAEIRRALREDAASPAYIRTVPKRGYAFTGPVIDAPPELAMPPASDAFVGRQGVVDTLQGALRQATAGTRRVVLITGPSGIGKTALVQNFLASVADPNICATWSRCPDWRDAPAPYAALFDAVARLLRSLQGMTIFDSLARHAPSWLARLQAPLAQGRVPHAMGEPTPTSMSRELVTALESIASAVPLVLWLDDLHWADLATIDVLASLGRRSDPARLLIIGTMWPLESVRQASALRQVTANLLTVGRAAVLDLAPLTEPDVERHLAIRFGAGAVSDASVAFHRATGGNPLFLMTALDYLVSRNHIVLVEGRWQLRLGPEALDALIPASLSGMMSRQLTMLTSDERIALEAASIVGMDASLWAVSAAADVDELSLEPVFRALERRGMFVASSGSVLNPSGIPSAAYRFRHELCRDVLLQEMSDSCRAALHRRLGTALERETAGRGDAAAAELARHFAAAGDRLRTVKYCRIAAREAERRGASRETVALLHGAMAAADRIPEDGVTDQRLAIGLELGSAQLVAGDPAAAATTFARVALIAADRDLAAMTLRAVIGLARASLWTDYAACLEHLRKAQALAAASPATPTAAAARIETGLMEIQLTGWSDAIADDCLASWRKLPVMAGEDRCTIAIGLLFLHDIRSAYAPAFRLGRRLVAASDRVGRLGHRLNSRLATSMAALHCGRLGEASDHAAAGLALADRGGNQPQAAIFRVQLAWIALEAQQWEDALELSLGDRSPLEGSAPPEAAPMSLLLAASAYASLRRLNEARTSLERLRDRYAKERVAMDWYWRIPLHLALAEVALLEHDADDARKEAAAAIAHAAATPERTWRSRAHATGARAALLAGDLAGAERELNRAHRQIAGIDAPLAGWRVEEVRAAVLERRGRFESAHRARRRAQRILNLLKVSRARNQAPKNPARTTRRNSTG